eukprot:SAG11_NODE_15353_length_581_cov_0.792531_1_plen_76_part_01
MIITKFSSSLYPIRQYTQAAQLQHVAEDQISAPRLMEEFDARCPRGSTRTDKNEDIAAYLRAKPGLLRLKPSATEV